MSERLLQASTLYKHFGDTQAVNGVSFDLHKGEILGFLGPNGAGKSTTMQMLCGVLPPSQGQVLIQGIDLLDHPRQAKRHIGYLPEKPPLYPELSVDEYLRYCAQLHQMPSADITQAVVLSKQRCSLMDVGSRLIGNLSKGYQQRVGIAQAILHNPAIVILDEPTVGLDPIQIREIRKLIIELGQDHGVILSTHILPEAQAVCNRVQIIHQGQLVYSENMDVLDQRNNDEQIIVGFNRPPPRSQLLALAGISQVEDLSPGRFRLHIEDAQPMAELIASAAVAQDWGLVELSPVRPSLEQKFVELTSGEALPLEQPA